MEDSRFEHFVPAHSNPFNCRRHYDIRNDSHALGRSVIGIEDPDAAE